MNRIFSACPDGRQKESVKKLLNAFYADLLFQPKAMVYDRRHPAGGHSPNPS